jgi:hypothetical protein
MSEVSESQKKANGQISSYQNLMEGNAEVIVTSKLGHKAD